MNLKRHKDFIKISKSITESVMQKDLDRMQSILDKSKGDKQKMINYATAMANAITDKHKAYQRGLAADSILDQEIGDIFYARAKELGLDFDVNLERSKSVMAKFGIEPQKLGSKLPAPRPEPTTPQRYQYSILPIGSVNIQTGECKYFNVYTTWPDSTAEVWKDGDNLKLVFTAGDKPLNNIGWRREFKHDQTGKFIGSWEMVEWVRVADLKELLRQFNKKSIIGYTYK